MSCKKIRWNKQYKKICALREYEVKYIHGYQCTTTTAESNKQVLELLKKENEIV